MGAGRLATSLSAALALSLSACWSPSVKTPADEENPLDTAPPADPAALRAMKEAPPPKNTKKPDMDFIADVCRRAAEQAQDCASPDNAGPRGKASVDVMFEPEGRSGNVSVDPPHGGTPVGECLRRAFEGLYVPAFRGEPVSFQQEVDLDKKKESGTKK